MRWIRAISIVAVALSLSAATFGQGGRGGFGGGQGGSGGFGGGGGPQGGGQQQESYDGSVDAIERAIATYLDGPEIKNILTPGEYSEWTLTLKAGQVVIAEARSEAFDPALQIVEGAATVLASNDDRYPGDQRPLLIWRCEKAGPYLIRARCFKDKSGGQFFLRFKIYDSIDLGVDKMVEKGFEKQEPFLVRIPMKAGQIKQVILEVPDWQKYMSVSLGQTISPVGLPDINLAKPLSSVLTNAVMAPVDGDYFILASPYGPARGKIRAGTREILPSNLVGKDGVYAAKAATNTPSLWTISVKAGDILEASTPELHVGSQLIVAEEPDISKYDLKKPELNPFFPRPKGKEDKDGPPIEVLPARARDGRISVFAVKRDAKLWVASNGAGEKDKQYTLSIKPAARAFTQAKGLGNQLRIGNTDYWAFDAKVGDVMTFNSTATGFAEQIVVRDPDLNQTLNVGAAPDQTLTTWNMITSKPGRYLVAISSIGDGGGGEYSLSRKVFPPKDFGKGSPAQGDFADGQTHVWKFTAKPDEPLLVRWKSTNWTYSITIRDESGANASIPLTQIDDSTRYGILKVSKPTTFLIVLIPHGKAKYSIELSDLPGYGKRE